MRKAHFQTVLTVALADEEKNLWIMTSDLRYFSALIGAEIKVPAGFVTDFASVPRLPLAYWLAGDKARCAAVVHDFLYVTKAYPREICDKIFLEAMEATGIPAWRRLPMYYAVKAAGWYYFNQPPRPHHADFVT